MVRAACPFQSRKSHMRGCLCERSRDVTYRLFAFGREATFVAHGKFPPFRSGMLNGSSWSEAAALPYCRGHPSSGIQRFEATPDIRRSFSVIAGQSTTFPNRRFTARA